MPSVKTSVDIDAPASKVKSLLVDFASYPEWNPFIRSISGDPVQGGVLDVFVQQEASKGMRFKTTVLANTEHELRWKGVLYTRWLLSGVHYFVITPRGPDACVFNHGEDFTGLIAPLVNKYVPGTQKSFEAMNDALKRRAEGVS